MLPLFHDGGERGAQRGAIALLRSLPLPQRGHVLGGDAPAAAGNGGGGGIEAGAAAAARGPQGSQATGMDGIQSQESDAHQRAREDSAKSNFGGK